MADIPRRDIIPDDFEEHSPQSEEDRGISSGFIKGMCTVGVIAKNPIH